jgi:hypothetical protein
VLAVRGRAAAGARGAGILDAIVEQIRFLTDAGWKKVRIAMALGISSFVAGQEYGHGGLSLQESIIPVVQVSRPKGVARRGG